MRKRDRLLLLILIASGWWLNLKAQPSASVQQYYYLGQETITFAPIATYQFDNKWYIEGRYNYEDLKTFSTYMGRTFQNNSAFTYTITPMVGGVLGRYKGGSVAANVSFEYKNFYLSTQPQYTVAIDGRENNFFYNWADLSYQITDWLGAGVSLQHTKLYQTKSTIEKGGLVEFSFKNWSVPLYIFNPELKERYFLVGVNFDWEGKKKKKTKQPQQPDLFDSTAVVLANKSNQTQSKPAVQSGVNLPESTVINLNENKTDSITNETFDADYYAVVLGPFDSKESAEKAQAMLNSNQKSMPFHGAVNHSRVLITGLENKKAAEMLIASLVNSKVPANILPYLVKKVEVYTVKQ